MEDPGSQLDLSSDAGRSASPAAKGSDARGKFLGVQFECCGIYGRIYQNRSGTAYEGRCPRCMKRVTVGIGPEGGTSRFYTAS